MADAKAATGKHARSNEEPDDGSDEDKMADDTPLDLMKAKAKELFDIMLDMRPAGKYTHVVRTGLSGVGCAKYARVDQNFNLYSATGKTILANLTNPNFVLCMREDKVHSMMSEANFRKMLNTNKQQRAQANAAKEERALQVQTLENEAAAAVANSLAQSKKYLERLGPHRKTRKLLAWQDYLRSSAVLAEECLETMK